MNIDGHFPRSGVADAEAEHAAEAIIDGRPIDTVVTGIRPGEKVHEALVSEEESTRTAVRGDYYVIKPMLPELFAEVEGDRPMATHEYSSADDLLDKKGVRELLRRNGFVPSGDPATLATS